MPVIIALLSGLVFSFGLVASGLSNPAKVIGFLDIFGQWDPSLMVVMGGAILVGLPTFHWFKKRGTTLLNQACTLEFSQAIDKRLVIGSLLFGAGWGLAGFCPGPSVVLLSAGIGEVYMTKVYIFFAAMLAGMIAFSAFNKLTSK